MEILDFLDARLKEEARTIAKLTPHSLRASFERVFTFKCNIVELHNFVHECPGLGNLVADPIVWDGTYGGPCETLTQVAQLWWDHPDFDRRWLLK